MSKEFSKIAFYATVKSEYSGGKVLECYQNIIISVIYHYKMTDFSYNDLCKKLIELYNFEIPPLAMQQILNMCCTKKQLDYDKITQRYRKKANYIDGKKIANKIQIENKKFKDFINYFINFVKNDFNVKLSAENAEKIISEFIEINGIEHLCSKTKLLYSSDVNLYIGKFILYLSENAVKFFEYFDSIIVSRMLTEFITFDVQVSKETKVNGIVIIDTSIFFRLIGVDSQNRKEIYEKFIEELKSYGYKIKIYRHTYNEIINLVNNAEQWIGNINYDPVKATSTTDYFITHDYSKEDISEFALITIPALIKKYNIEIFDIAYPAYKGTEISEEDYYFSIIKRYKEVTNSFDEEQKRATVEYDAKSLYYTQQLCNNNYATSIVDIQNVFVTTNGILASVSQNMIDDSILSAIPFCVSDVFLSMLVWINNPAKNFEGSKQRLLCAAKACFDLPDNLLHKLTEIAESLLGENEITAEECYLLKGSLIIRQKLMDMTKGNESLLTEKTTVQLLNELRIDAMNQGRSEERKLLEIEFIKQREEDKNQSIEQLLSEKQSLQLSLKNNNEFIDSINKQIAETNGLILKNNDKIKKIIKKINIVIISLFVVLIVLGFIFLFSNDRIQAIISYICSIIPMCAFVFNICNIKKISISSLITKQYENEISNFKNKISDLNNTQELKIKFNNDIISKLSVIDDKVKELEKELSSQFTVKV